jgi:transcriptional regulator with XRE-family HTH domain
MSGDLEIAGRKAMSKDAGLMINEALRLVRLYWGFSQTELAERLSISQSMISEIERGTKPASMDILERYSKNLGIRLSQLIFFAEELEGQPLAKRGRMIIASHVLELLRMMAPQELTDATNC